MNDDQAAELMRQVRRIRLDQLAQDSAPRQGRAFRTGWLAAHLANLMTLIEESTDDTAVADLESPPC